MKRFLMLAMLLPLPALAAEPVAPPTMSPPDTWVPKTDAIVRVLNKIDSTVQEITLKPGAVVQVQSLSLALKGCFVRPDDLPQDATAHLQIDDNRAGTPGFDGWILKNEPSLNMLEHPVYDVQLVGCA
jgi:hypothetical protein